MYIIIFCYLNQTSGRDITTMPSYSVQVHCLNYYWTKTHQDRFHTNIDPSVLNWIQTLDRNLNLRRQKRQARGEPSIDIRTTKQIHLGRINIFSLKSSNKIYYSTIFTTKMEVQKSAFFEFCHIINTVIQTCTKLLRYVYRNLFLADRTLR
jgi:hypothetical protein